MYILQRSTISKGACGDQLLEGGESLIELALLHQLHGGLVLLKGRCMRSGGLTARLGSQRGSFLAACRRGSGLLRH